MPHVVIALGSNLGDSVAQIGAAVGLVAPFATEVRCSAVYRSDPMYLTDQPAFLNAVAVAQTDLGPRSLLSALKDVEKRLGRAARVRNGPREIDLDLVAYGRLIYRFDGAGESLTIPHPRLAERRFVLEPLFSLEPDLWIPGCPPIEAMLCAAAIQSQTLVRYADAPVSL